MHSIDRQLLFKFKIVVFFNKVHQFEMNYAKNIPVVNTGEKRSRGQLLFPSINFAQWVGATHDSTMFGRTIVSLVIN